MIENYGSKFYDFVYTNPVDIYIMYMTIILGILIIMYYGYFCLTDNSDLIMQIKNL